MRALIPLCLCLCACGGAPEPTPTPTPPAPTPPPAPKVELPSPAATPAEAVGRIATAYFEELMRAAPTWATYRGDRRYDAELPAPTKANRDQHHMVLAALESGLAAVDRVGLDPKSALAAEVLQDTLRRSLDARVCEGWAWQVDQLGGPQVWMPELPNYHTVPDEPKARALVTRYRLMKPYYEAHVAGLRDGLKRGLVAPRINVERVIAQVEKQLAVAIADSPYAAPLKKASAYKAFASELTEAIEQGVYAGLRAYLKFLKEELLPKSRTVPGVSALKNGEACYAAMIQKHTGLSLSADEIHAIGLAEVKRISKAMDALAREAKVRNAEAWLAKLPKQAEQHRDTREALLSYNEALLKRAQAALPKAFGRIPKTPVELKSIEPFREKDAPAAYYYSAPEDGSRPAYYYLNTYEPKTRLLYKMPALAYHEAVPGHHFQIALANENTELPIFMRHIGQTAFVEGWALYAEVLADELGLYHTPEERMGAYTYEIWRAVRLVVDTGLHAKGWSRQKAIDYLAKYTGHDQGEVVNEIDRYIIWPGQALAYKLGQLEISRLRAHAEKSLGPAFDLKAFHDHLLDAGAVPLKVAAARLEKWIQAKQKN